MNTLSHKNSNAADLQRPVESELHTQMHRDHIKWASDIAGWQADFAEWQIQIRKVLVGLKELQTTLEEHETSMIKQSENLVEMCKERAEHEHALAQFALGETPVDLIVDAVRHQDQSEKYEQLKLTHEGSKQWHRTLLSQWEKLHKSVFSMNGL